ncbi:odorant receptor 85b-like [Sitophilus oryzae]|uniref:Odorant receptor 85b-like n=1 Tax=Sitophilus oryzae TaxID=7048 RepID=A0A6J2YAA6_SITOR|nr:odorant receptor 85b-like [Sitophilus oryzae]
MAAKIDHLRTLLEGVFQNTSYDIKKQKLKVCILYHQQIIRLNERISALVTEMLGQISFVAAIVISCIGNVIVKQYSIGALVYMGGFVTAVYMMCLTGQIIKDETLKVDNIVFNLNWYTDLNLAKDMVLIMRRSQKPVNLRSFLFGVFDYQLLVVIIKTSYSYFTLMTQRG